MLGLVIDIGDFRCSRVACFVAGDVYVHADLHGASSVIVKNPSGKPYISLSGWQTGSSSFTIYPLLILIINGFFVLEEHINVISDIK